MDRGWNTASSVVVVSDLKWNYLSTLQPHLQVPGPLHVLPQHVLSHAVEHAGLYRRVWRAQAGFPQGAHQPVSVLAVELTELCGPTVRLPSYDAVRAVQLLLYGVVVKLHVTRDGQNVASQAAETLPEQEEAVDHPGQLQVLLGIRATDAAVEEGQLGRRVGGHGETSAGPKLSVLGGDGGEQLENQREKDGNNNLTKWECWF